MQIKKIEWWSPEIGDYEKEFLLDVCASNYLNEGQYTERFESELAARLGVKHAVAATSGTAALFLGLAALGIGPGDEVIVPDVTFIASINAVKLAGATPVLADIEPERLNLDPQQLKKLVTSRTRAIMPVHVSGRCADMTAIMDIAARHGLSVIEDAAEGLGSKGHGKFLGTIGHVGCISFSPNKIITTGQGGLVLTDDSGVYGRLRELKDQGRPVRGTGGNDIHYSVGYNFKFTNLQAAVGLGQLKRLDVRLARMKDVYRLYREGLAGLSAIRLPGFKIEAEEVPQWVDLVTVEPDRLIEHLAAYGIGCRRYWNPIHTQTPYRLPDDRFPVSTELMRRALWLPSSFKLSDSDIGFVCDRVKEFFSR